MSTIVSQIKKFDSVQKYYQIFDVSENDPLRKYGFVQTADDSEINKMRLQATIDAEGASIALSKIKQIDQRDYERDAPRFITIYNDLLKVEAFISLSKFEESEILIQQIVEEGTFLKRSDIVGEALILRAKSYVRRHGHLSGKFDESLSIIEGCVQYFDSVSNTHKIASLRKLQNQMHGMWLMHNKHYSS